MNARLLKKCSDEVPYAYALVYSKSNKAQKERLDQELNEEVKKMFDATRTLNSEKYDSDYLSGKAE